MLALLEGRLDEARSLFAEALATFTDLHDTYWAWMELFLDQVDVEEEKFEASDSLREGEMPGLATATMGDVGAAARGVLDEATADAAYEEGSRMELEDALAYALQHDRA